MTKLDLFFKYVRVTVFFTLLVPLEKPKNRFISFLKNIAWIFNIFSQIFIIISVLVKCFAEEKDWMEFGHLLMNIGINVGGLTILIYIYFNAESVVESYRDLIILGRSKANTIFQEKNVEKKIAFLKIFIILFFCMATVSCNNWSVRTIVNNIRKGQRNLILDQWWPYDWGASPWFELTYIFQNYTMYLAGIAHCSIYFLYLSLVGVAALQIELLSYEIEEMFFSTIVEEGGSKSLVEKAMLNYYKYDHDGFESLNDKECMVINNLIDSAKFNYNLRKKLKNLIKRHQEILEFLLKTNTLIGPIVLVILGFTEFYLIFAPFMGFVARDTIFFGPFLQYTFTAVVQLYFLVYIAQEICNQSTTFQISLYNSPWYLYDKKTKKLLLTVLTQCNKPLTVRAGKIFTITMETFVQGIQMAYSATAVLMQLYLHY